MEESENTTAKRFNNPTQIISRNERSRIVYYWVKKKEQAEFWDGHWEANISDKKKFYEPYLKGYLGRGQLRRIFLKHLPKDGKILEGGCGMGQYVLALRARGFDCIGIDFADETVGSIQSRFPDLPVQKGNILDLDLDNESLSAYISLGIVEHFEQGPQKAISEAFRVLKKDGVFLVSVPHVFKWRRESAQPEETPLNPNSSFYQYAFHTKEFRRFLHQAGFSILEEYGMESHFAFRTKYAWFRKFLKWVPRLRHLDLLLDPTILGKKFGRMHMYVAIKK
jgi:SAM-dependent methyltransferase